MEQVIEEKDKDITQSQTFYDQRKWLLALPPRIFEDTHVNGNISNWRGIKFTYSESKRVHIEIPANQWNNTTS